MQNNDWLQFLSTQGFEQTEHGLHLNGEPTTETDSLVDLSNLAVASVEGEDAQAFLQGQLSNDITLLTDQHLHQLAAYCNPKGRMLALFNVLKTQNGYALIAPTAIMEKVLPRLKMFVMRSKVIIAPSNQVLLGFYSSAENSNKVAASLRSFQGEVFQHASDPRRYFLLADLQNTESLWLDTKQIYKRADSRSWQLWDIQAGIPQLFIENYEALIPQTVNLDLVGGVNFKKGCYPGQEIIARVKYRGKPKTRMITATCSSSAEVSIGMPAFIENKDSSAGNVINACKTDEGYRLNISVPVTHLREGAVYLDEGKTLEIERAAMPNEITV